MYVYDEKTNCWIKLNATSEYRQKKKRVRDAWIVSMLFMMLLPIPAVVILSLFGVFLSLSYLDESEYSFEDELFEF